MSGPGSLDTLIKGYRILGEQGHDELHFGHVSVIDRDAGLVWLKQADRTFSEVTVDNLVATDLEGRVVRGTGPLHSEVWLHLGVYAAREDVNAIAHSHACELVACAAGEPEWPVIDQYTLEMSPGLSWYDRACMIATAGLGADLAQALGTGRTCILRSHGALVADSSIEAAVVGMVELGRAVKVQLAARTLGRVRPMPLEDVELMRERFLMQRNSRVKSMWATLSR